MTEAKVTTSMILITMLLITKKIQGIIRKTEYKYLKVKGEKSDSSLNPLIYRKLVNLKNRIKLKEYI